MELNMHIKNLIKKDDTFFIARLSERYAFAYENTSSNDDDKRNDRRSYGHINFAQLDFYSLDYDVYPFSRGRVVRPHSKVPGDRCFSDENRAFLDGYLTKEREKMIRRKGIYFTDSKQVADKLSELESIIDKTGKRIIDSLDIGVTKREVYGSSSFNFDIKAIPEMLLAPIVLTADTILDAIGGAYKNNLCGFLKDLACSIFSPFGIFKSMFTSFSHTECSWKVNNTDRIECRCDEVNPAIRFHKSGEEVGPDSFYNVSLLFPSGLEIRNIGSAPLPESSGNENAVL